MAYKNIEDAKAHSKKYYLKNKEKIKQLSRLYRLNNIKKVKEINRLYYLKNKKTRKEKIKLYILNNKEKRIETNRLYNLNNKEKKREYNIKYKLKNPHIQKAILAKRRAAKLKATPKFANLEKIKEIYKNCPKGYHVDHIVPLQGKEVCGLHVEWNLQYLTPSDNHSKSNKLIY
jgi:hypothetical protein